MDLSASLNFSLFGSSFSSSKEAPQQPVVVNIMPQPSSNCTDTKKKKKKKTTTTKKTTVKKKQHQGQVMDPRYYLPYPSRGNYDPRSYPHRPRLTNGDYDRYHRQEEKALRKSNGRYYPAPAATKERWPVVYREEAGYARGHKQNRSYHGVTKTAAAAATGQKQNRFYPAERYGYAYGYGYGGGPATGQNRSYPVTRPHGNDTYRLQACEYKEEESDEESDEEDEEESECDDEEESDDDDDEEEEEEAEEDEEEESDCEETVHHHQPTRRGWQRSREEYQHSRRAYHRY